MRRLQALVLGGLLLAAATVCAQAITVLASVDRAEVRENESFTYTIRAEGRVRGEPDLAPLEQEVDIVRRTSTTRVQIVNGETLPVTEWLIEVMPRGSGLLTLPALEVGGVLTSPIEVEVAPAEAADGSGDLFMEVEVDSFKPYVQSQAIYRLRIFFGVNTGRGTLTPPEVVAGEAIIEPVDQEQYQTERAGRTFTVHERRFAIFPQRAGELTIGPAAFETMVLPDRGFSRMQRLTSEPVQLEVRPAISPPNAAPGAAWLPATRVVLSERWSERPGTDLVVGVPQTRTIVVEAEGVQETQLPPLGISQNDAIRQYPDQPELSRDAGAGGLVARRVERYVVMGLSPGEVTLPPVELPWWNVTTERWELARLPARAVTIAPGSGPQGLPPLPLPLELEEPSPAAGAGWWPALSAGLLLVWVSTLALWWRERRAPPQRPARKEMPVARRSANKRLLRQLRSACDRDDSEAVRRLLLEWGRLRFPEAPPRSLGALAERVPGQLARELEVLEAHTYGGRSEPWKGSGLRAALAKVDSVAYTGAGQGADPLLPLYR